MQPRRALRRSPNVTAVVVALVVGIAQVAAPPSVSGVDPAHTVDLLVSWTRPGVPDTTYVPPAPLRVGDEVTATPVRSGFGETGSAVCYLAFARGAAGESPLIGAKVETLEAPTCLPWTFIVPPTATGLHTLSLMTMGGETERFDVLVELTVEPGGTPRAVTSDAPLISWDPATVLGTEQARFGQTWMMPMPADAERRCQYSITGSYLTSITTYGVDDACSGWTLTMPDIRPPALRSGEPNGSPWQVEVHGTWERDDGSSRSTGRMSTDVLLVDDASDPTAPVVFSSSRPAAVFLLDDNDYFVYPGEVTRAPHIVGIDSGTCRYAVKQPGGTSVDVGTVPIIDGACAPLAFDVTDHGSFQAWVTLIDDSDTILVAAGTGGEVIPRLPPPVIELPPDPVVGEPVEIDASTPGGAPLEYEIEPVLETATAGYAAAAADPVACDGASGTFLLGEGERSATATCTFSAPGTYRVTATFRDPIGTERQTSTTIAVAADTVAPTITALRQRLVPGSQLGTSAIPVQIAWTASDAGSGVDHVEVARQTDGGAWVVIDGDLAAASITRDQYRGHRYRFRVRAVDSAGNVSPWSYTATFGPTAYSETNAKLRYTGTWSTAASSGAYGGGFRATSRAGASATITFTGRSVAWVAPKSPIRGWAKVYLDGAYKGRVNLGATSLEQRRLVYAWNWTTRGTHTLRIVNEATSGRPRIDLDAIVVLD